MQAFPLTLTLSPAEPRERGPDFRPPILGGRFFCPPPFAHGCVVNNYLKAAGGGAVAGVIGAAIWGGITYATHREIGWIAWGMGFLVGLGVRLVARDNDGVNYGMIAVALAFLSIVLGKYLAVALIVDDVQKEIGKIAFTVTDEDMVANKADEVAKEWQAKNKPVYAPAPAGTTNFKDVMAKNYLPAVTAEARKRWQAIPAGDRQKLIDAKKAEFEELKANLGGSVRKRAFADSFTPFDALWFILAGITAFRIGSGAFSTD